MFANALVKMTKRMFRQENAADVIEAEATRTELGVSWTCFSFFIQGKVAAMLGFLGGCCVFGWFGCVGFSGEGRPSTATGMPTFGLIKSNNINKLQANSAAPYCRAAFGTRKPPPPTLPPKEAQVLELPTLVKLLRASVHSDIGLQSARKLSKEERMSLGVVLILSKRPTPRRLKDALGRVKEKTFLVKTCNILHTCAFSWNTHASLALRATNLVLKDAFPLFAMTKLLLCFLKLLCLCKPHCLALHLQIQHETGPPTLILLHPRSP